MPVTILPFAGHIQSTLSSSAPPPGGGLASLCGVASGGAASADEPGAVDIGAVDELVGAGGVATIGAGALAGVDTDAGAAVGAWPVPASADDDASAGAGVAALTAVVAADARCTSRSACSEYGSFTSLGSRL